MYYLKRNFSFDKRRKAYVWQKRTLIRHTGCTEYNRFIISVGVYVEPGSNLIENILAMSVKIGIFNMILNIIKFTEIMR